MGIPELARQKLYDREQIVYLISQIQKKMATINLPNLVGPVHEIRLDNESKEALAEEVVHLLNREAHYISSSPLPQNNKSRPGGIPRKNRPEFDFYDKPFYKNDGHEFVLLPGIISSTTWKKYEGGFVSGSIVVLIRQGGRKASSGKTYSVFITGILPPNLSHIIPVEIRLVGTNVKKTPVQAYKKIREPMGKPKKLDFPVYDDAFFDEIRDQRFGDWFNKGSVWEVPVRKYNLNASEMRSDEQYLMSQMGEFSRPKFGPPVMPLGLRHKFTPRYSGKKYNYLFTNGDVRNGIIGGNEGLGRA